MAQVEDRMKGKIDEAAGKAKNLTDVAGEKGRSVASTLGGAVDAVKEKAHDVATGASDLLDKGKDTAREWASSVSDAAVYASDKTRDAASATVEKMGDVGQELTAFIRRYPLQSLLVGLGIGFLAAQMFSARSRHDSAM